MVGISKPFVVPHFEY